MNSPFKLLDSKLAEETARKELIEQCKLLVRTDGFFVPLEGAAPISISYVHFQVKEVIVK
jgi:hypothetical protein